MLNSLRIYPIFGPTSSIYVYTPATVARYHGSSQTMPTLSERVTTTLRDWILHGRLKPGARIEEIPLAEEIGASRTPVRAALATLANEGLIDHQPNRGYSARVFDLDVILAAYKV